jgi:hypothetical protein
MGICFAVIRNCVAVGITQPAVTGIWIAVVRIWFAVVRIWFAVMRNCIAVAITRFSVVRIWLAVTRICFVYNIAHGLQVRDNGGFLGRNNNYFLSFGLVVFEYNKSILSCWLFIN